MAATPATAAATPIDSPPDIEAQIEQLTRAFTHLDLVAARSSQLLCEFTLDDQGQVLAAHPQQLPGAPCYRRPQLRTLFTRFPVTISSAHLPPLRPFWPALLQHESLGALRAWFAAHTARGDPIIIARRRCLKDIWSAGLLTDPYLTSKLALSKILLQRDGATSWLDLPREPLRLDEITAVAAQSAGFQFQNMCMVGGDTQPTGVVPGFFTAVGHHLVLPNHQRCLLILFGEIDAKTPTGEYVELKCQSSHPRFWGLEPEQRLIHWIAAQLNLATILARGHRDKRTECLDKFEELAPASFLTPEQAERMYLLLGLKLQFLLTQTPTTPDPLPVSEIFSRLPDDFAKKIQELQQQIRSSSKRSSKPARR
jgi:hypothetical protein